MAYYDGPCDDPIITQDKLKCTSQTILGNKFAINPDTGLFYINDGKMGYPISKFLPNYLEEKEIFTEKQKLKHQAKSKVKRKFIVGDHYYLRSKSCDGSKQLIKEFEIRKVVYTINDQIANVLIVKQISGVNNAIFTLNRNDCKKLHIKFEPGLQVFDINLNWIKKNDSYK